MTTDCEKCRNLKIDYPFLIGAGHTVERKFCKRFGMSIPWNKVCYCRDEELLNKLRVIRDG